MCDGILLSCDLCSGKLFLLGQPQREGWAVSPKRKAVVVWKASAKPIPDIRAFWKGIIVQPEEFPALHIFLRMCMALTPSDAVVENAFSRSRRILADERMSLSSELVEQLLLLALDSPKWDVYNYEKALAALRCNAKRTRFRGRRADRGHKRLKGASTHDANPAPQGQDDSDTSSFRSSSSSSSSGSSCSLSSSGGYE